MGNENMSYVCKYEVNWKRFEDNSDFFIKMISSFIERIFKKPSCFNYVILDEYNALIKIHFENKIPDYEEVNLDKFMRNAFHACRSTNQRGNVNKADVCKKCGNIGEVKRMSCICNNCGNVIWGC